MRSGGFISVGEDDKKVPLLRGPSSRRSNSISLSQSSSSINTDVRGEILSAWKRLKIPLAVIFMLFVASLGLLVAGIVIYASAATHAQALRDDLNNAITTFTNEDDGGFALMSNTTFYFTVNRGSSILMNFTSDPYYDKIHSVQFAQPYESRVIKGEMPWKDVIGSVHLKDNNMAIIMNVSVRPVIVGEGLTDVSLTIPVWYTVQTTLGSVSYQREACSKSGGYVDTVNALCVKYYVLDTMCAKLSGKDKHTWQLDAANGGSGCFYPFDLLGGYALVPYTGNYTKRNYFEAIENTNLPFFIRSGDDPYITLEVISKGTLSLDYMHNEFSDRGKYLIAIGSIVMFCCIVVMIVLFFVRRAVKHSRSAQKNQQSIIYSRPPVFRYLGFTIAFLGITIGVGLPLLHHWSNEYYWIWTPFLGLWLVLICTPIAIVSIVVFWGHILKTRWPVRVKFGLSITSSLAMLALCAVNLWYMVMPGSYVWGNLPGQVDPLFMLFGVIFCLAMIPFSILNLLACYRALSCLRKQDDYNMLRSDDGEMRQRRSSNLQKNRKTSNGYNMILVGLWVLGAAFVATMLLPPIWNVVLIGTYNVFNSECCSLVQNPNPPSSIYTFIPKIYLDVVMFYAFLAILVIMMAFSAVVISVNKFFHFWLRIKTKLFEINTCVGEILVLVMFSGLTAFWVWFWLFSYPRIATIDNTYERIARGFGHITNLFSSLLLFPVTRNSMWVQLIGIPFERAVTYHRWLGVLTICSVTSHMVTFWFDWAFNYKALIHNIFSLQNAQHPDNWSPPMMILMWVGLIFMGLFSFNWFRRRKFELFYYTHHFFLVFFATGLIHAWSLWYFLCGGLTLWFVDRLIRFWRGTKAFSVISLQAMSKGETTEVLLQQNSFKYRAGQYAFINIPAIAPLEWHPFTISSSPGDDTISFHIKNMGKGSWTARLNQLCEASNSDEGLLIHTSRLPVINIDGPYGAPPQFKTASIVLIAGGIGITPVLSIFKDYYQTHQTKIGARNNAVQHITLIWVVRDAATLEMFRDLFNTISTDSSARHKFDIILYVTGSVYYVDDGAEEDLPTRKTLMRPPPRNGRPNMQQEITNIVTKTTGKVGVMVCGPPPLVKEVRQACYQYRLELHEETFEL